jgi:alpha-tubulin suppressor-like RCC1 family protein
MSNNFRKYGGINKNAELVNMKIDTIRVNNINVDVLDANNINVNVLDASNINVDVLDVNNEISYDVILQKDFIRQYPNDMNWLHIGRIDGTGFQDDGQGAKVVIDYIGNNAFSSENLKGGQTKIIIAIGNGDVSMNVGRPNCDGIYYHIGQTNFITDAFVFRDNSNNFIWDVYVRLVKFNASSYIVKTSNCRFTKINEFYDSSGIPQRDIAGPLDFNTLKKEFKIADPGLNVIFDGNVNIGTTPQILKEISDLSKNFKLIINEQDKGGLFFDLTDTSYNRIKTYASDDIERGKDLFIGSSSNPNKGIYIKTDGSLNENIRVGINNDNPEQALHVKGETQISDAIAKLLLESLSGEDKIHQKVIFKTHDSTRGGGLLWQDASNISRNSFFGRPYNSGVDTRGIIYNSTTTNEKIDGQSSLLTVSGPYKEPLFSIIDDTGNVGIGTGNPSEKLDVNGDAIIRGEVNIKKNIISNSMVSAGNNFSLILLNNEKVKAFGSNSFGQLGNGSTDLSSNIPVDVSGVTKPVKGVSAGENHSIILIQDGTVKSFGSNSFGQLGNGSSDLSSNVPVNVSGINNAIAVEAGKNGSHSLVLLNNRTVKSFGSNSSGQLGNGSSDLSSNIPVDVSGINNAIAISAGSSHSLILLSNGTVKSFGSNSSGQLGNGSSDLSSNIPVDVSGINNAIAISAGSTHSLILLSNGMVKSFGSNSSGQLGNGSTDLSSNVPVDVSGINNAIAIAAGLEHSLILLSNGMVKSFGSNSSGQLGNGSTDLSSNIPVDVSGILNGIAISAGASHSHVVLRNSVLKSFGSNSFGELGNGSTDLSRNVPVVVPGGVFMFLYLSGDLITNTIFIRRDDNIEKTASIRLISNGEPNFHDIEYRNSGGNNGHSFLTNSGGNVSTRFRISGNGNVGIGTTTPSEKLDISGNLNMRKNKIINVNQIDFSSNDTSSNLINNLYGINFSDNTFVGVGNSFDICSNEVIKINNDKLVINTSGNVGIGTTEPEKLFDVSGDVVIRGELTVKGKVIKKDEMEIYGNVDISENLQVGGRVDIVGDVSMNGNVDISENAVIRGDLTVQGRLIKDQIEVIGNIDISGNLYASGSGRFDGNVGIGRTNPNFKLDISYNGSSNTNYGIQLHNNVASGTSNRDNLILFTDRNSTQAAIGGYRNNFASDYKGGLKFFVGSEPSDFWKDQPSNSTNATNSLTEAMRINSNGNVGIGTTTPEARLDVNGDILLKGNNKSIWFGNNNQFIDKSQGGVGNETFFGIQYSHDNNAGYQGDSLNIVGKRFQSNQTNDINQSYITCLSTNGNVGINNTNPQHMLDVSGTARIEDNLLLRDAGDGTPVSSMNATNNNSNNYTNLNQLKIHNSNNGMFFYVSGGFNNRVASIQVGHNDTAFASNPGNLILNPVGGNVGIGTANPSFSNLHIATGDTTGRNGDTVLRIGPVDYRGSRGIKIGQEASRHEIHFSSWRDDTPNKIGSKIVSINTGTTTFSDLSQRGELAFFTHPPSLQGDYDNTIERMRIDSNGNVGIGTANPTEKLDVNGNTRILGNVGIGTSTLPLKINNYLNNLISCGEESTIVIRGNGDEIREFGIVDGVVTIDTSVSRSITAFGNQRIRAVSSGKIVENSSYYFVIVLLENGKIKTKGFNQFGQLGNGSSSNNTVSTYQNTDISGIDGTTSATKAVAISAGGAFSLILMENGTVKSFGRNSNGQLGDGTTTQRNSPVNVSGIDGLTPSTRAVAISAGRDFSLIVMENGTVKSFGRNNEGQLGDGTATQRTSPVNVSGIDGSSSANRAVAVSAGINHSMVLMENGTVKTFGNFTSGQLGNGDLVPFSVGTTSITFRSTPQTTNTSNIVAISAGKFFSMALTRDGYVTTCGINENGQLGKGDVIERITFGNVLGQNVTGTETNNLIRSAVAIAAGGRHAMLIMRDGTLRGFGDNSSRQAYLNNTFSTNTRALVTRSSDKFGFYTLTNTINVGNKNVFRTNGSHDENIGDTNIINSRISLIKTFFGVREQTISHWDLATDTHNSFYIRDTLRDDIPFVINERGQITVQLSISTTSDDRLKFNEKFITNATETILKLRPQIYDFKINENTENENTENENTENENNVDEFIKQSGLIAQEIYYDAPELRHIVKLPDGIDVSSIEQPPPDYYENRDNPEIDPDWSSWGDKYASVNYIGLIPYLIKSLQESHTTIQDLKKRIEILEQS